MIKHKIRGWMLVASFFTLAYVSGAAELPSWARDWKNFFRTGFSAVPLQGLPDRVEAIEVRCMNGRALGWLFRTDQIEPYVKGYKDQIGVKVALSRDRKILGVAVIEHQETPRYFEKLGDGFFSQFKNRSLESASEDIHTVTGATVSSRAIVRDVFESARKFLEFETVKAALSSEKDAPSSNRTGGATSPSP